MRINNIIKTIESKGVITKSGERLKDTIKHTPESISESAMGEMLDSQGIPPTILKIRTYKDEVVKVEHNPFEDFLGDDEITQISIAPKFGEYVSQHKHPTDKEINDMIKSDIPTLTPKNIER